MSGEGMKVLVVDDDATMREVLKMRLEQWGLQVLLASDAQEATSLIESQHPDMVISDVIMPEISGLELLRILIGEDAHRPVILITAHGSVDMAVEAIKVGAQDFLTKPLDYSKLKSLVGAAQREIQLRQGSLRLDSELEQGLRFGSFVGRSKAMRQVYKLIKDVAGTDASVLITGESGTGKELVAKSIHEKSLRAQGPLIAVNAAAVPSELIESEIFGHEKGAFTGASSMRQGCFELAHQGTLFLDEIAEMPVSLQTRLLRVLEDGRIRRLGGKKEFQVDVRVLAATNRDPRNAVDEGRLREDIYYRLNVFTIHSPALRTRKSDIPLLAQYFISAFNQKHRLKIQGLREDVLERLRAYSWPGNVRELKNVVERAVVLAKEKWIENTHLPPYIQQLEDFSEKVVLPGDVTIEEAEKQLILKTLEQTRNNKAEAARRLGLDVKTIRNKLKSYGLM
jgi:DNA-binding NtrC family response regulator